MCRWPYWPYSAHDASTHGAGILNQYRQLAQERNETTKQRKSKACAERKTESTMLPQQQCRRAGSRHWPNLLRTHGAYVLNECRQLAQERGRIMSTCRWPTLARPARHPWCINSRRNIDSSRRATKENQQSCRSSNVDMQVAHTGQTCSAPMVH